MKALKVFFTIVLFVFLINSCDNPFNAVNTSEAGSLPAGKGSVYLKIAGAGNERTIMPVDLTFAKEDLHYELIFTGAGGAQETVNRTYSNLGEPVLLDMGTYRLEVNAYADENYGQLLFSGTAASITIEEGKTTPVEITLQPVLEGGEGTFSWDITLPPDIISAVMEITNRDGGTPIEITFYNKTANIAAAEGARNLPSGFYDVTITLTGSHDVYGAINVTRKEILHIYNGQVSPYEKSFADINFDIVYTVTFLNAAGEPVPVYVVHGAAIPDNYFNESYLAGNGYAPPSDAFLYEGAGPDKPGYTFAGWYLDNDFTEEWTDDTPITNNITLYPKWDCAGNPIDVFGNTGDTNIVNFINNNTTMGSTYTLVIAEDVTLEETLTIKTGVTLTVTSADTTAPSTINRGFPQTDPNSGLFIVGDGAGLTFKNIIIHGQKDNTDFAGNTASLVRVNSSGIFTMNDGAVLRNNRAENGGGVYVDSFGMFTIDGGTISGNEVDQNGGAVFVNGTFFTMNGGTIGGEETESGNTAGGSGGGVYLASGTFTMNGGTISNNTATNEGGGVFVYSGTFEMSGGTISGNTAISGGGVYVYTSGPFKLGGKAIIKGNKNGNDNNNVFLLDGKSIQIEPPLTESAEIWVTTTTANNGVIVDFSSGATSGVEQYFRSDVEGGYFIVDGFAPSFQLVLKTDLAFEFTDNDTAYSVKAKAEDYTISGDVIIPAWYNGLPVTEIGEEAFYDELLIQTVTFAAGSQLTSIGDSAFAVSYAGISSGSLTSITIPASVRSICEGAFSGRSLQTVTFAAGSQLQSIGTAAFASTGLTSIEIPASVTSIGDNAFSNCQWLTNITVGANNQNYASQDGILYNNAKTSFVHIPQAISGVVTIPEGITEIGYAAFSNCTSLIEITIPASVTSIGDEAFYNCSSLTTVTCLATTPPTLGGGSVFENINPQIKVPANSEVLQAYKDTWITYADFISTM